MAYYGTAGTGVLGVLGEVPPDEMQRRLGRAAQPFRLEGERIQSVYELIVTVADPVPGPDGDFNHDIAADHVRDYIKAAHRHQALVVLDLQPGRADFLTVAKRWAWALRDPWVGLALDPEWRMGPRQVPGRVIGSVGAAEVNEVSAWLSDLVEDEGLPEKPFVLHQFRASMIREIERVADRDGLALVQHVDGFGTQAAEARDLPRARQARSASTWVSSSSTTRTSTASPRDRSGGSGPPRGSSAASSHRRSRKARWRLSRDPVSRLGHVRGSRDGGCATSSTTGCSAL